ncbi:MAG: acyl carrier protein, partial [Anaerolineales bacterium]|nr:acyl carrier protein [Anaerolineales bacterium]
MDIKAKIRQYVAENFLYSSDGFHLSDDASFLEEEVIDSTGVMELVMFVEEEFKITVDDEDIVPENFDSVNQLA